MRGKDNLRSGGEVLVDQLLVNGVRHVFCVPGESYLAALDAFHDRDIAVTVCRQEGGAVMMAEAAGKLTGRPGIAFVTRGPGATNGSPGTTTCATVPPSAYRKSMAPCVTIVLLVPLSR